MYLANPASDSVQCPATHLSTAIAPIILRSQSLTSKQDHRQYPASEVSGAVAGGGVYPSGTAKQPPQFLPYQGLANLAMVSGQCLAIAVIE
ncbi:MAG: hypothetical protein HC780_29495 [Leptolyngbyaceae cyanobacterium CSU_1_3]|nr:hypothetical protein [Leptolyngbyaceae cyanobacterium CSU_1_3]